MCIANAPLVWSVESVWAQEAHLRFHWSHPLMQYLGRQLQAQARFASTPPDSGLHPRLWAFLEWPWAHSVLDYPLFFGLWLN